MSLPRLTPGLFNLSTGSPRLTAASVKRRSQVVMIPPVWPALSYYQDWHSLKSEDKSMTLKCQRGLWRKSSIIKGRSGGEWLMFYIRNSSISTLSPHCLAGVVLLFSLKWRDYQEPLESSIREIRTQDWFCRLKKVRKHLIFVNKHQYLGTLFTELEAPEYDL